MESLNKKQEEIQKRKMTREIEIRTVMSEKINKQKTRESRLNETRYRHESEMENSHKELTEKLDQINQRVF